MQLDKSRFAIDNECPIFTVNIQDVLFDIDNKKVFIRGVEQAKIIKYKMEERPDGFHITARISLISENKYLSGKECLMEDRITIEYFNHINEKTHDNTTT